MVTLRAREFGAPSLAAPFREAFDHAQRRAAETTAAWAGATDDLSAWGPALAFSLLGSGLAGEPVMPLVSALEAKNAAPQLLWRTLGLYAAKSHAPFDEMPGLQDAVQRNLGALNRVAHTLDAFAETRELKTWGPIGVAAWVAYLDLLYRDYWDLGDPGAAPWNAAGLGALEDLLKRARLPDGKGFRFGSRDEVLTLWPNALMLLALVKAYENEELVQYETAAIGAVEALEALRDVDGAYFSTGARSDRDPRANVYLAHALLLLAKDTGDRAYRERAVAILRWLTTGVAAAALARDAALESHTGYVILLLDSLATQPRETLFGWRPLQPDTPAPVALQVAELRPAAFRYRAMFDGVFDTLATRLPRRHGDFAYDYGDSPGYATEMLLVAHQDAAAREVLEREDVLLAWPRPRNFDEISFAAAGFFAALGHPDTVPREWAERSLRRSLALSGAVALLDRHYLDWVDWLTGGGGYGYGPTVLGSQVAQSQLRFAEAFPRQCLAWFIDPAAVGRALVDAAGPAAWDESRRVYRARPGEDDVWLLPNAMMILALLQAHAQSGDHAYLERAEAVASGLDRLWEPQRGAYFASATQLGPGGYLSLSTNSYAALAFHQLGVATGKPAYRERAQAILDFFQRELYRDGVVYHHVYRGHRSAGDIWCPGCNWRLLSVLRTVMRTP